MRFSFILSFLCILGCSQKYVPDSKLEFDKEYRSLFDAVTNADSIVFYSLDLESSFNLIKVDNDSTIQNSKGYFTNQAPYKYVECKYHFTDSSIRDNLRVYINKEGLSDVNTFRIGGETCWLMTDSLSNLNKGFMNFLQKKFQNVYLFKMGSDRSRNCYVADFISIFYLNSEYGIIAILDKNGMYWYNRSIFNL